MRGRVQAVRPRVYVAIAGVGAVHLHDIGVVRETDHESGVRPVLMLLDDPVTNLKFAHDVTLSRIF